MKHGLKYSDFQPATGQLRTVYIIHDHGYTSRATRGANDPSGANDANGAGRRGAREAAADFGDGPERASQAGQRDTSGRHPRRRQSSAARPRPPETTLHTGETQPPSRVKAEHAPGTRQPQQERTDSEAKHPGRERGADSRIPEPVAAERWPVQQHRNARACGQHTCTRWRTQAARCQHSSTCDLPEDLRTPPTLEKIPTPGKRPTTRPQPNRPRRTTTNQGRQEARLRNTSVPPSLAP